MACCCAGDKFKDMVWPPDPPADIQRMHICDQKYLQIKTQAAQVGVDNYAEMEAFFGSVEGVISTKPGRRMRSNKNKDQSEYIVQITFESKTLNFGDILRIFWRTKGSRKKTAILFYDNEVQKKFCKTAILEHFYGKGSRKNWDQASKDDIRVKNFNLLPTENIIEMERKHHKEKLQQYKKFFGILGLEKTQTLIESHFAARLNGFMNGYGSIFQLNNELRNGDLVLSRNVEQAVRAKMARPVQNAEIDFVNQVLEEEKEERRKTNKKENKLKEKNVKGIEKMQGR